MNVGDYVRIDGYISKAEHIKTSSSGKTYVQWKQPNGLLASGNINIIEKSSPNIIDLIEVGDFINGECVLEITEKEKTPGFKRYFVTWRSAVYGERIDEYELKRILETIVTKEQFEAMEYKVEV